MPRSPRVAPSWALVLRLLALLRPPGLSDACTCAPAHPQQHFCHSEIVIRGKISSEKVVPASKDPDDPQKMIRYAIKQIKMFKGFAKIKTVHEVYTPLDPSLCGVKLDAKSRKHYLLTGQVLHDGKFFINLCNYVEPWEHLTLVQRESLNHHYAHNCHCEIITCYTVPCGISAPNECLWTDWLLEQKLYGFQAKNCVCMRNVDGTCGWYRGHHPLKKKSNIIQP